MQTNKRFIGFGVIVLVVCTLAFITGVTSSPFHVQFVEHYAGPLAFAFAGVSLLCAGLGKTLDEKIALGFLAWFVLSSGLRGDLWLENHYLPLCEFVCVYAIALPAARLLGRKALTASALAAFILPAALAAIAIMASMTVDAVYIPYIRTAAGMTGEHVGRLQVGSHPNTAAAMFLIALLFGVWLLCHTKRRWLSIFMVPMCLALYAGIALTVSRTVMVQVAFAAALSTAALLWNRPWKTGRKLAAAGAGAVAAFVVAYMGFDAATQVVSWLKIQAAQAESVAIDRPLLADLATLTGRTDIYAHAFQIIGENPGILLCGVDASRLPELLAPFYHTHNAYLQALVCYGLPGLAAAVWFTVRALWAAWRVALSRCAFQDKLIALIPLALLPGAITEIYLFCDGMALYNMAFFLCLGFSTQKAKTMSQV